MHSGNRLHRQTSLATMLAAIVFLTACSSTTTTPGVTPVEILQTQAAQTVIAEVTAQGLLTPSPTATSVPTATNTATPTEIPTETATNTPSATIQPTTTTFITLIDDNFSNQTAWATQTGDDFGFGYLDDGYTIYINLLNAAIWSIRGPTDLGDVRVETTARRFSGPVDGYYGVICRHLDEDNYYAFMISDTGGFGIASMVNGEFTFITETQDTRNIIRPNETNRVSAECVGSRLTLFVNDVEMLSINDTTHQNGSAGLVAKTRLSPGFQALYSTFRLATP